MNRHEAREQAFILVFEKSFKSDSLDEILEAAQTAREITLSDFARHVFIGVENHLEVLDRLIDENSIGWKRSRLSRVAASLLRLALYEMLFEEDIPVSVSINEAVELAKKYGTGEDASFINGLLGTVAKKLEQEGGVEKKERKEQADGAVSGD
ncbi:MAG TPA: transcription antitermination factor NusB [Candidatus Gallacutalibacter stercoravium]|nr:transcription antitermination factor NusB [Candidatus Gallacutalibacter stercoravium]